MKKIIIIAVIFLVSLVAIFNLSKIDKKEMKQETKQTSVNSNKKEKKKNSKSEDIDSENINTENVEINDSEVNETKDASAIDENNNTGNNSNNNNNKNNKNSITSDSVSTPIQLENVLTEWEKIGISEYAYYNTPNDNEGELAIKGDLSLCKNELNRLLNAYYDNGFDGGNTFTINGKYTHSYLGCGINVYMNGKTYTYNQIKSMGYN